MLKLCEYSVRTSNEFRLVSTMYVANKGEPGHLASKCNDAFE